MGFSLTLYDQARAALEAARSTDEVLEVLNQAEALKAYARQAKDPSLIAAATEIKLRAERRLGTMMAASISPGGDRRSKVETRPLVPTLSEAGIDKHLADRARKAAALAESDFEDAVAQARENVTAYATRTVNVIDKAERRAARERALGARITALPDKRYGVIYADPPWRFETYSERGKDRSPENHYPTMDLEDIIALPVPAADDCVLFLWATPPGLDMALEVMSGWVFEYKTAIVWVKSKKATGYWQRAEAEYLLIGTRGHVPAPAPGQQFEGVYYIPREGHSKKPDLFAEEIAKRFPSVPRLEMFARGERDGWDVWGNEVQPL